MAGWGAEERTSEEIGARLRQWRLILGLSQELVAQRSGVGRGSIARLEAGDESVSMSTFLAVAGVLGLIDRLTDAVEPLNTELGRARADRLGRERAPRRRKKATS